MKLNKRQCNICESDVYDFEEHSCFKTETECEVCNRKVFSIDLEEIHLSIFQKAWACDTCRQEIKENLKKEFDNF